MYEVMHISIIITTKPTLYLWMMMMVIMSVHTWKATEGQINMIFMVHASCVCCVCAYVCVTLCVYHDAIWCTDDCMDVEYQTSAHFQVCNFKITPL